MVDDRRARSGKHARVARQSFARTVPALCAATVLCLGAKCGCGRGADSTTGGAAGPRRTARAAPAPRAPGPASGRNLWEVPRGVKARDWRYIVIHHSGTTEGSARAFDRYHRKVKGWEDLGYHFVIGNGRGSPDGAVEVAPRWREQRVGAHAGVLEHNERGVGVCLVGDFERAGPTAKQMASLRELLAFLMNRFEIAPSDVLRHSDLVATKCPGRNLPWPVVEPDPELERKRRKARERLGRW
jgi:hypothetical protein